MLDDSLLNKEKSIFYRKILCLILSGSYVLSFMLPSANVYSGTILTGYSAFFLAFLDNPYMIPWGLFLAVGNIFMLLAVYYFIKNDKYRDLNSFIKWGLTIQCLLIIIHRTFDFNPDSTKTIYYHIGFYVWMIAQIGMCILYWF